MNITVLIDNGHGINTPGKCSPIWSDGTQLFEWQYNRIIARRVKAELEKIGVKCELIVPEEVDISLWERVKRINAYSGRCIVVSIHCNAAGSIQANGWECWTTTRKNNSDKLAECFLDNFKDVFPDKKNRGAKEKHFTILNGSKFPIVLTENFFMTNEEECKWMLTDECISKIVNLHVISIKQYLELYA